MTSYYERVIFIYENILLKSTAYYCDLGHSLSNIQTMVIIGMNI